MTWGLAGALLAALCYGSASVVQAIAVQRMRQSEFVDPRLLGMLIRSPLYLLGIFLDIAGFVASLEALRTLPLFLVQAATSASLGVTALLAARLLKDRPKRPEWIAIGGVVVGLSFLGLAAGPDRATNVELSGRTALLLAVVAVGAASFLAARWGAGALGMSAGLAFGLLAISARVLANPTSVRGLLLDPAAYALGAAGVLGNLLYATALQRGAVTLATAASVAGETFVPALIGLVFLGDRPAKGLTWAASLGFTLTVAGALSLARYGRVGAPPPTSDEDAPAVVRSG